MKLSDLKDKIDRTKMTGISAGFIGRIKFDVGLAPKYANKDVRPLCFVSFLDGNTESDVIGKSNGLAEKHMGESQTAYSPFIKIEVLEALTDGKFGGSLVSLEDPQPNNEYSQREAGRFLADYSDTKVTDQVGGKMWVHINWLRLTPDYGGDLTLFGDDADGQSAMVLTHIANKKEAIALLNSIRSGDITLGELARSRGYDYDGVYDAIKAARGDDTPGEVKLTAIGKATKNTYGDVEFFTSKESVQLMKESLQANGGDIAKAAEAVSAEPGDVALIMNNREYFEKLAAENSLSIAEDSLPELVSLSGIGGTDDLANMFGLNPVPF